MTKYKPNKYQLYDKHIYNRKGKEIENFFYSEIYATYEDMFR